MLKRPAFRIVLAVLLLAVAAGFLLKKRAPATPPVPVTAPAPSLELLPGDVLLVGQRDLRRLLPLSGSLRPLNQVSVKARVAGEVHEVLVREGEEVKEGQVLARMDASDYQARVVQAQGALRAARGQLDIATKARDNNKALLDKGFISQNGYDNASSQFDIARANVDSARGALDVAQKALADTVVRAPIAGLIASRSVQPGEKVAIDAKLLDVVDLRQMELEAAVPASDILHVAPGQEVQLSVEGLATPFAGKVARINPATQAGSRSIMIYIRIDNPQLVLRAGMFAEGHLTLEKKTGVLAVPATAVRNSGGKNFVYAIENGRLVHRPVTLGIAGNDGEGAAVEVVAGLAADARIVKTNLGDLPSGVAVKLVGNGTQQ